MVNEKFMLNGKFYLKIGNYNVSKIHIIFVLTLLIAIIIVIKSRKF